jgi:hypothetical protein
MSALALPRRPVGRPGFAAEVEYDPGDTVYFTYCHAHPPAMRINPGDTVKTSTRDASNERILGHRRDRDGQAGPVRGQSADRAVLH